MVLRLAQYSSSLFVVLSLSLSTSHSVWWYSEYPCTHRSPPGGTQTITLLITVCLVALRLSLYSSQSTWWLRQSLYSSQSLWWYSDYLNTHHSLSLYSLQSPWWYLEYSYAHHSLPGGTQTIHILIKVSLRVLITVSLVVLRLFLYSSQSP